MAADQENGKPREQVRTERESVRGRVEEFSTREERLATAAAEAEKAGNADESGRLKEEQEILSLEKETFAYERDNTGAYVGERWGQDLAKRYGAKGERPVEFSPDGSVKERAEDKTSFSMVVAMGELDRMNKEGGQKAGDWALEHATSVIESACAGQKAGADGASPSFEIYRSDGNAFAVEFRNMTETGIAEVKKQLQEYRGISERLEKAGITEAPPLAVSELPHSTMVAALDAYFKVDRGAEAGPGEGEAEAPRLPDADDVQRTMVDIVKTASAYNSEIQKYISRCERMVEAVAKDGLSSHTLEFFGKYVKKGLSGSKFDDPVMFQELLSAEESRLKQKEELVAVSSEHLVARVREVLRAEFEDAGKEYAATWLANDRAVKSERDRAIVESVLKGMGEGSRITEVQRIAKEADEAPRRGEGGAAKKPFPLLGKAELAKAEADAAAKAAEFGADSLEAKKAKAIFELEKVKRDPSTGLERKRSYFFDVQEKLAEGKECSSVFIDMAFLKYFDREGGTEVGNDAIDRAAGVLERAVEQVMEESAKNDAVPKDKKVRAKVYRFGGDEFSISVEGGAAAAQEIKAAIERLAQEAGPVPGGKQSKATYRDTGLTFNIGIASAAEMRAVEDAQRERGVIPKEESDGERVKRRSELMTDMADAGLGPEKSLNRFVFLVTELQDPRYPESLITDPDAKGWEETVGADAPEGTVEYVRAVNKLVEYSEKAIFAQGADLREWALKIRNNEATIDDFIAEKREAINEKMESSLEDKKRNKLVLDLVVQAKVNEKRLRDEIRRTEDERDTAVAQYGKAHEEVQKRDRRIDELNKKIEDLARKFIQGQ